MSLQASQSSRAGPSAVELVEMRPAGRSVGAPILLLHGAFAGAWCWQEHFVPAFADLGRHVAALNLRAHAVRPGDGRKRQASIEDYLADITAALSSFERPPVLIAHSFGGYLAQLLIGQAAIARLVLVSSLPPDGLSLVGPRLALMDPMLWFDATFGSAMGSHAARSRDNLNLLFGEHISTADQRRFAGRFVRESHLALAQAHLPRWVTPAGPIGVPTLVLHGRQDRLIWPTTSDRTAMYHGAEQIVLPESGHFMMLDAHARRTAASIHEWLRRGGS